MQGEERYRLISRTITVEGGMGKLGHCRVTCVTLVFEVIALSVFAFKMVRGRMTFKALAFRLLFILGGR